MLEARRSKHHSVDTTGAGGFNAIVVLFLDLDMVACLKAFDQSGPVGIGACILGGSCTMLCRVKGAFLAFFTLMR